MKIAISIPNPIFTAAEQLAAYMGKSRNQLYAEALAFYVEANQASVITEQLNAVYSLQPAPLDTALQAAQFKILSHETW